MPVTAPDAKPGPKPSLADLHWRATLRGRKHDGLESDMISAIETNDQWRFKMLLQVDAGWARDDRVLRKIIECGREDMFTTLTSRDPGWQNSVNAQGLANEAAGAGQLNILKTLVEKCDVDIHHYSEELLRTAVSKRQEACVGYLIGKGADVKTWSNEPLRTAADNGDLGIVKLLVDAGAEINTDHYGQSVLGRAVASGSMPLVEYLIDKGADIKHDKYSAFTTAAREGRLDMLQLFIDRKVDANVEDGAAFIAAVDSKQFDAARLLLALGATPDAQGGKALRLAASHGDEETVTFLLDHRANPNAQENRETALSEAVGSGNDKIVKLLLSRGANHAAGQGYVWERAKQRKGMLRALVRGVRAADAITRDLKKKEFEDTFGGGSYTVDDLRNTKGPSGDTGLLIAAQSGKFVEYVGSATSGRIVAADLYHPDDRIDTVFSFLLRHKRLQDFFHPSFWAERPTDAKEAVEQLPEKYQKRVKLGPIANEIAYRELKKKAAGGGRNLKPQPPKLAP